jgi:hypothetical protein
MEESTKKRWFPMAVVFLSVFGSFAALMYMSITTFPAVKDRTSSPPYFRFQQNPVQWEGSQEVREAAANPARATAGWTRVTLLLDQENRIGDAILTYRGLGERDTIRIDAVIPDLDSQYTYRHQFALEQANGGFKVGGQRLKLVSAGRYRVRLMHYVPAR